MRVIVLAVGVFAVLAAGNLDVAHGRPSAASGCSQLGKLKSLFPTATAIGFAKRLGIRPAAARQPVWPGRCGAFWTTYNVGGKSVDVAVTLYKSPKDVGAALAEPLFGAVHVLANGAHVRVWGPSRVTVAGTAASTISAVSAFRNIFISSSSVSTAMTPVSVALQLRIHRRIETAFARPRATH